MATENSRVSNIKQYQYYTLGLKIGESYHDLNMLGLHQTKPGVAFAATLEERDERPISSTIFMGHTRFSNENIPLFGKCKTLTAMNFFMIAWQEIARHRLDHAPWYHFWFDDCQTFGLNDLARNVLYRRCSIDQYDLSWNAELKAMYYIACLSHMELFHWSTCIFNQFVVWCFGSSDGAEKSGSFGSIIELI